MYINITEVSQPPSTSLPLSLLPPHQPINSCPLRLSARVLALLLVLILAAICHSRRAHTSSPPHIQYYSVHNTPLVEKEKKNQNRTPRIRVARLMRGFGSLRPLRPTAFVCASSPRACALVFFLDRAHHLHAAGPARTGEGRGKRTSAISKQHIRTSTSPTRLSRPFARARPIACTPKEVSAHPRGASCAGDVHAPSPRLRDSRASKLERGLA